MMARPRDLERARERHSGEEKGRMERMRALWQGAPRRVMRREWMEGGRELVIGVRSERRGGSRGRRRDVIVGRVFLLVVGALFVEVEEERCKSY